MQTTVLLEAFGKVGIQRPLRKYERIRNVINSWDFDRQNSLIVMPSATGGIDIELEADYVPIEQPTEYSCMLNHSQKPSKWDKRFVTIRTDGQVTVAKAETSAAKETTNICHISDFDIYSPNPASSASKRIKPPKKFCFAIKSQQKSSVFESNENFVHFFCTSDRRTAAAFYSAIQGWRNWYLVNQLGLGGGNDPSGKRQVRPGSKDSQYQIGSFKPLFDIGALATTVTTNDNSHQRGHSRHQTRSRSNSFSGVTKNRPQSSHLRTNGAPPSSFPRRLANQDSPQLFPPMKLVNPSISIMDRGRVLPRGTANPLSHGSDHHNNDATAAATFAPTGLLGRTYTQRQHHSQDKVPAEKVEGPFVEGPSLLNSVASASSPQRRPTSKDKGTGPLITAAKSSEQQAEPERRPRTSGGATQRSPGEDAPFTEDGLLAGLHPSPTKRGKNKSRDGPMLDITHTSKFEKGSLLEQVEKQRGGAEAAGPVLDRSKGREVVVGTGEI